MTYGHSLVACFFAALLVAGSASAQEGPEAAARDHFAAGVELVQANRLEAALSEFRRAQELHPSCNALENVARLLVDLGRSAEAAGALDEFLEQCAGGSETEPGQADLELALREQRRRVGEVVLEIAPEGAQVSVGEGASMRRAGGSIRVFAPPGPCRIAADLEGYVPLHDELLIEAGTTQTLRLELRPSKPECPATGCAGEQPAAVHVAPPSPPRPPRRDEPHDGTRMTRIGYGIIGVGALAALVGLGIALHGQAVHRDALEQWEAGDHDLARSTEDEADARKTTGYVTMGAGGLVGVAGAVVLFTARPAAAGGAGSFSPGAAGAQVGLTLRGAWE